MSYVAGQITSSGLVVAPLTGTSEAGLIGVVDYLVQQLNTIYGAQLSVDSNTPDGQAVNVFGQIVQDILQLLIQINSGFDPTQAFGNILYQRGSIVGIQPQAATYSTAAITAVVTGACILYGLDQSVQPPYTISDSAGNQWQLKTTQTISASGTYANLPFQAANPGSVEAAASSITTPVTVVIQVSSVTNPAAAVPGSAQETDAAFKLRLLQSSAIGSIGYLPGLQSALRNIAGITYANAYENVADATDPVTQQAAHSVWVVVAPGSATDAEIAQVIYVKHNGGCGIYVRSGGTVVTYVIPATITFVVSSANASAGAVYTNNGQSFTVLQSISGGATLLCSMSGSNPTSSGTLTLSSGTGDATITFSAYDPGAAPFTVQWNEVIEENLYCLFQASSLDGVNPPDLTELVEVGSSLIPSVGSSININQVVTALQAIDPNSLITFPGLHPSAPGTGASGLQVGAATANSYSAKASPAYLDEQLQLSTSTVIATFSGITQDFTSIDGGLGQVTQQLQVAGFNPMIAVGSAAIQVVTGSPQTFDVYGGYFNGGTAAVSLVQNSSGAPAPTLAVGMNPAVVSYTAGATTNVYDVLKIEDSLGNLAYVAIKVVAA